MPAMWCANDGAMTLDELRAFVAWAYGAGVPGDAPVGVGTNITPRASKVRVRKMWAVEKEDR